MNDGLRQTRSLRFRLLITVNSVVLIGMFVFLWYDYQSEFSAEIISVRKSLDAEAETILLAVQHLRGHNIQQVQQYIDDVCRQRDEIAFPGHHIVAKLPGQSLQATVHGRNSKDILALVDQLGQSGRRSGSVGEQVFLVGASIDGDVSVFIANRLDRIAEHVGGQLVGRTWRLLLLGLLATALVNAILTRLVTRPVQLLANAVRRMDEADQLWALPDFGTTEFNLLGGEIRSMSESLGAAENERRVQLEKARKIQDALVATGTINVSGYEIAVRYQPAEAVGGDLVDYVNTDDGTIMIVADVCGHGVPAALVTLMMKVAFRGHFEASRSFPSLFVALNKLIAPLSETVGFVTMFAAQLKMNGDMTYMSAGHERPVLHRDGNVEYLDSTGLPLGIDPQGTWELQSTRLSRNDRLVVYTDGLVEIGDFDRQKAMNRLTSAVCDTADLQPAEALNEIMNSAAGQSEDDVCVAVIDRTGDAGGERKPEANVAASGLQL